MQVASIRAHRVWVETAYLQSLEMDEDWVE